MGYGSVSLSIHNGTIFVLNGAEVRSFWSQLFVSFLHVGKILLYPIRTLPQVGNYVEQFDLQGNYLGEWPGWYNWPDEMVGDIIQHLKTQTPFF